MALRGGVKAAAEMLAGLNRKNRQKVLGIIAEKNPEMAEVLKQNMVIFEDLVHLDQKTLAELLREINIDDLALGLRIASEDLKKHILSNLPKRLQEDVMGVLNGPLKPVSQVQEAVEKVMTVVREKVDKGEIIFKDDDEYV